MAEVNVSWLIQPMGVVMQQHLQSLADYPPVQGGFRFDMSTVVEEFINMARQQAVSRRQPGAVCGVCMDSNS